MPKVLLVPGINTDGADNVHRLGAPLSDLGLEVVPVTYRTARWYSARWRRKSIAHTLLGLYDPGDSIVAHSFGCLVTYTAMEMGAEFGRVVFLSAAMERDARFPCHGMTKLLNLYNPHDRALTVGSMLPFGHPFGPMGRDGYAGVRDDRIIDRQHAVRAGPHNHTIPYFASPHIDQIARRIYDFVA
jgi:hypothetical protein